MAYDIMEVELVFEELNTRSEKSITAMKNELAAMKAGRANVRILDKILVDYYGTPTPINQMANITVPEARVLAISVWDASAIKNVEKAILASNIGITPINDGKLIRLIFPELTEERRRQLVKEVKTLGENTKVAIRNIRRDAIEDLRSLKKNSIITEDDLDKFEKDVEKAVNGFIAEIDKMMADKEKEIMSV
ncbi:MAG TPA: ribosome recycling factor [Clostridia bacterium]|jgi:ribosome recycling factor|nr:ribosome recycling factor [Clostridia bacterium]HOL60764.1 ribosome recycling factor [Clostridia bacterium]HPO53339.1 ribosome recycling factor [Clostridia bacterium]